jgi:hypothetical protein
LARLLFVALLAILRADSAMAQGAALVNDGPNLGAIAAGGTNTWTFSANSGDNVVLRLGTTNFNPALALYGPDGSLAGAAGGNDDLALALAVTNGGAYTVVVTSGAQGGSGSYSLHFAQIPEPFSVPAGEQGGPLVNGGDNAGTLGFADLQMWTFTANAGDHVALRMVATNFNPGPVLFGPDGAQLFANCCAPGGDTIIASFTATNSGVFTVLVTAANRGGTGSYILRMAQFGQPFSAPAVPLANGDNLGNLALGGLDRWSFIANPGDNIILRMVTTNFSANPTVYSPDGALLFANCCAPGGDTIIANFTATNSGAFTVLVACGGEGNSGSYLLRMAQFSRPFPTPAVTLTNGGDNPGNLVLGGLDRWTFTANAGDTIAVRMVTTNFNANPALYGPDGALLFNDCCAPGGDTLIANFTATNGGAFTVLVEANEGQTGPYIVRLAEFSEPFTVPALTLANGGDNDGNLVLGGLDRWTFNANAGDNIALRLVTTNFNAAAIVLGPDGSQLFNRCCAPGGDTFIANFTATGSGAFTVLVFANEGQTGPYALRLAEFSQPFAIAASPLANGGDNLGNLALGGLDRWTFNANAGDNIALRMATTNFNAQAVLYGPDGALLVSACCAPGGDTYIAIFTATNSGAFTVLVYANEGQTGSYVLRLAEFSQPFTVPAFPLANGADNLGNLVLGGLDRWTFTANAGDSVFLRMFTTNFNADAAVYGPNGALLATACCGIEGDTGIYSFMPTNTGVYTVLVNSGQEGETGSYVLRWADLSGPFSVPSKPFANGAVETGTLGVAALDRWEFTACVGDWIAPQLATTNFFANFGLYGPDGSLLASAGGSNLVFSLPATNSGTFTLLVSSASEGGVGEYTLLPNGLTDGVKLCPPAIEPTTFILTGIGGATNAEFVISTAPILPSPQSLWASIYTNRFDRFGLFNYTNAFDPTLPPAYFRLTLP